MKNYKPFLVVGLAVLVLTLSACGTKTTNTSDNMDNQEEDTAVSQPNATPTASEEKKINSGEFSAEKNPNDVASVSETATATKTAANAEKDLSSQIQATDRQPDLLSKYSGAILKTNQGDIQVKFYNSDSPVTVNNFLYLAQAGFYDGSKFHRVIKDFMIQGGDPNSKDGDWSDDGYGGPGYYFKDEINSHKLVAGSLAMANSGAGTGTNGSQFFIVTATSTPWLDGAHTNFGEVVSGMDIVRKIEAAKVNENDHPTDDLTINSIELLK